VDGLWKVPVEGGDETKVLPSLAMVAFAIGDERIYFISTPQAGGDHMLEFLDLVSGKSKPIAPIGKLACYGLTVSRDGQWFVYSQVLEHTSDLMLVENFH
jgi:hypothetical protein